MNVENNRIKIILKLSSVICERLNDKVAKIRVLATQALQKFAYIQVEYQLDLKVVQRLASTVQDSNKDQRNNALWSLGVVANQRDVIPIFIQATTDDVLQIRCKAYVYIKKSIPIHELSYTQIEEILQNGLQETEDKVRNAFEELISFWYTNSCLGNVNKFLEFIQPERNLDKALQLLCLLLDQEVIVPQSLVDQEASQVTTPKNVAQNPSMRLTEESSIVFYALVLYYNKAQDIKQNKNLDKNESYSDDGYNKKQGLNNNVYDNDGYFNSHEEYAIRDINDSNIQDLQEALDQALPESQVDMLNLTRIYFDMDKYIISYCLLEICIGSIEFSESTTQSQAQEIFQYLTSPQQVKKVDVSDISNEIKVRWRKSISRFAYIMNGNDVHQTFDYTLSLFLEQSEHIQSSGDQETWLSQVDLVLEIMKQPQQFPIMPTPSNEELLMNYMQKVVFIALGDGAYDSQYRIKTVEMANMFILCTYPNWSDLHRFLLNICYAYLHDSVRYATKAIEGLQDIATLYSPQLLTSTLKSEPYIQLFENKEQTPEKGSGSYLNDFFKEQGQQDFGILLCRRILQVLQETQELWIQKIDKRRNKGKGKSTEVFEIPHDTFQFLETSFYALYKIVLNDINWWQDQKSLTSHINKHILSVQGIKAQVHSNTQQQTQDVNGIAGNTKIDSDERPVNYQNVNSQKVAQLQALKAQVNQNMGPLSKDSVRVCISVMIILSAHPLFGENQVIVPRGKTKDRDSVFQRWMYYSLESIAGQAWRSYDLFADSILLATRISTIYESQINAEKLQLTHTVIYNSVQILEQGKEAITEFLAKSNLSKTKIRQTKNNIDQQDQESNKKNVQPPQGAHYNLFLNALSEVSNTAYNSQTQEYLLSLFIILLNIKIDHEQLSSLQISEMKILVNDIIIEDNLVEVQEDENLKECLQHIQAYLEELKPRDQLDQIEPNQDNKVSITTAKELAQRRNSQGLLRYFPNLLLRDNIQLRKTNSKRLQVEQIVSPQSQYPTRTKTGAKKQLYYEEQL